VDLETGDIISNIGVSPRIMSFGKINGYRQYHLDLGHEEQISAYGQCIVYLAKYRTTYNPKYVIDHMDKIRDNNKADNLRCITHKENLQGDWRNKKREFKPKFRLPIDQKLLIRKKRMEGDSYCRLAREFKVTRQTVARICRME
jgi:hypothetical protein